MKTTNKQAIDQAAKISRTDPVNWAVSCRTKDAICLCNEEDGLDAYMDDGKLEGLRVFKGAVY